MRKTRIVFSTNERRDLWRRWRAGESLSDISRALERKPGTIYSHLKQFGGMAPRVRERRAEHLSLAEREEISRGIVAGESCRAIAGRLGRSPSTVSREIARSGGRGRYRASIADGAAWRRSERPKKYKLQANAELLCIVAEKLTLQWSPEQISGWLRREYASTEEMRVSHETIYKTLYIQARGALKQELVAHLRTRRRMRKSKKASNSDQGRGQIVDAVAISERPPEVEDRSVPGHWEGDLITGSKNSHIATLVERRSRFLMLVKVAGKDATTVAAALKRAVKKLPAELRASLTWDRGTEMAKHKSFTVETGTQVYFCDPKSPWQRGSNENTNGLLRQYFPKGTDLSVHSQEDLNRVAVRLNQRPRKTLAWACPADTLLAVVH